MVSARDLKSLTLMSVRVRVPPPTPIKFLGRVTHGNTLLDSILNVVNNYTMTFPQIYQSVLDDYGSVSKRTVYRYVRKLRIYRLLMRIEINRSETYYRLSKTGNYYLKRVVNA